MRGRIRRTLAVVPLLALATCGPAQAARLKADYQFNSSLASSVAGAPDLVFVDSSPAGPAMAYQDDSVGGATQKVLAWTADQGLTLNTSGLVAQDTWSVVLRFRFANTTGYRRILGRPDDGITDDSGVYTYAGEPDIYDQTASPTDHQGGGAGLVAVNTYVDLTVTHAADGTMKLYHDGTLLVTFADANHQFKLEENTLRLFKDDGSEESDGKIARLRVYDGAISDADVAAIDGGGTADADGDGVTDGTDSCPSTAASTTDGCAAAPPADSGNGGGGGGGTSTPPPSTDTTPAPTAAGQLSAGGKAKVRAKQGVLRFATGTSATCAAGAACTVTATLKAGKTTLGKVTFTLAGGKTKPVVVTLSKRGAKALRKAGTLKAKLTLALTRTGSIAVTASRSPSLKAP